MSPEMVREFFKEFSKAVEGVPPENIFNYDETNFTEDPGAKKAFFLRGTKYAEKICDSSKNAISVLFCGSAAGDLLPIYVVYQAINCYEAWCQGGPPGSRYSATARGWFNFFTVEDWFTKIFLPHRRTLTGKVVLICDNLRTHFNLEIMRLCKELDVEMVCLPPNFTDKMQPLDVAVFGPLKAKWRDILHELRTEQPHLKALDKTKFPSYMKRLIEESNIKKNLIAGFAKCGLWPLNEDKVLERLPSSEESGADIAQHLDKVMLWKIIKKHTGNGIFSSKFHLLYICFCFFIQGASETAGSPPVWRKKEETTGGSGQKDPSWRVVHGPHGGGGGGDGPVRQ